MRRIVLALLALFSLTVARADEGMWLLKLMQEQHLADSLRKAGLQLAPEALYSDNRPSLRDVVGRFGGGCTGEVVSPDGLIFTNNHCGFSFVQAMSDLKHNYLQNGFFAKSRAEELPVPGLTFTFVVRIDDVTARVEALARQKKYDQYKRQSTAVLGPLAETLLKSGPYAKAPGVSARIVPFFGGNRYFLFVEQRYDDVRLVVNPPQQIAQFGFNQDNWMWPRHNADFAVFRIYADAKGQPARYAKTNVPLHREKWLPISLRGVEHGDYTMIMGFPGRTSRFLTASQVRLRCESINEPINLAGEAELRFMKSLMDSDKAASLKYAGEYMKLGNMVKNFGGMNASVASTRLLDIKAREEAAFREFAARSGRPEYRNIIERIDSLVAAVRDTLHDYNLLRFTYGAQDFHPNVNALSGFILRFAPRVQANWQRLGRGKKQIKAGAEEKKLYDDFMRSAYRAALTTDFDYDLRKMKLLAPYWAKHHRLKAQPDFVREDMNAYFDSLYTKTDFRDTAEINTYMATDYFEAFSEDPVISHWLYYERLIDEVYRPALARYEHKLAELEQIYVRGLCEMYGWTKAPDANSTLRMTYGSVRGYSPRDAVQYDWHTGLKGMFEKENPADPDYVVDEKLRQHYLSKNYGPYADANGELPTCFLTNNDITGGNSGSAVLNARGELIGLAFDGNIESLSSDLRYNPQLQRCINADIRYILFVIDTYGGSHYLINEMDIRR